MAIFIKESVVLLIPYCLAKTLVRNAQSDLDKKLILDFLNTKFADKEPSYYLGSRYKIDKPIDSISTPLISSKSGLRIYKTYLNEFIGIALLIDKNKEIQFIESPLSDDYQGDYNNSLIGIIAINDSIKRKLIEEISLIFNQITSDSKIGHIRMNKDFGTASIYHHGRFWKTIRVDFKENKISKISIINNR